MGWKCDTIIIKNQIQFSKVLILKFYSTSRNIKNYIWWVQRLLIGGGGERNPEVIEDLSQNKCAFKNFGRIHQSIENIWAYMNGTHSVQRMLPMCYFFCKIKDDPRVAESTQMGFKEYQIWYLLPVCCQCWIKCVHIYSTKMLYLYRQCYTYITNAQQTFLWLNPLLPSTSVSMLYSGNYDLLFNLMFQKQVTKCNKTVWSIIKYKQEGKYFFSLFLTLLQKFCFSSNSKISRPRLWGRVWLSQK